MVSLSDAALVFGALLVLGSVVAASGQVELPGTSVLNDLLADPSVEPETEYKLTTEVSVGPDGLTDVTGRAYGFKYKTEKDSFLLSLPGTDSLSFFTGAKDVQVDYVLRTEDGRVLDSERKRIGDVSAGPDEETVTFETGNLKSGSYEVVYTSDFQRCVLGVCSDAQDKTSYTVQVPKLPLGEY